MSAWRRKLGMAFLIFVVVMGCRAPAASDIPAAWKVHKEKHFLIHYVNNRESARRIGHQAEEHYRAIAQALSLSKRDGFWLWERRVRIYIYGPCFTIYLSAQIS